MNSGILLRFPVASRMGGRLLSCGVIAVLLAWGIARSSSAASSPEPPAPKAGELSLEQLPDLHPAEYKAEPYLRAAASLQSLGKDRACAKLLALADQGRHKYESRKVIVLCRLLFTAKPGAEFRRPMIGVCGFPGGTTASDWPLEPIEVVDGVPFFVTMGYANDPYDEAEPVKSYVKYCLDSCDWIAKPWRVPSEQEKAAALQKLLASPKWKKPLDVESRYWTAQQIDVTDHLAAAALEPVASDDDLREFTAAGKRGLKDAAGNVVAEAIYDDLRYLSDNLIAVNVGQEKEDFGEFFTIGGGKWGILDIHGKLLVPVTLEYVSRFSEGLVRIADERGTRFLDRDAKVVIDLGKVDGAYDFHEGLAPVHEDRSRDGKDFRTKYIDKTGRTVFTVEGHGDEFHEGLAVLRVKPEKPDPSVSTEPERFGYIDRSGKVVVPPQLARAEPFSEGLAAVRPKKTIPTHWAATKGDSWGYIDKSGKYVIGLRFNEAQAFCNGVARVHIGGTLYEHNGGRFFDWNGGQWQQIDRTGKVLATGTH